MIIIGVISIFLHQSNTLLDDMRSRAPSARGRACVGAVWDNGQQGGGVRVLWLPQQQQ